MSDEQAVPYKIDSRKREFEERSAYFLRFEYYDGPYPEVRVSKDDKQVGWWLPTRGLHWVPLFLLPDGVDETAVAKACQELWDKYNPPASLAPEFKAHVVESDCEIGAEKPRIRMTLVGDHGLKVRLTFNGPLPEPSSHPRHFELVLREVQP